MSSSVARPLKALAADLWFDDDMMHVRLADSREIAVPLEWFPKLKRATKAEQQNWRLIGNGIGVHWPKLDEDLSVAGLLEA